MDIIRMSAKLTSGMSLSNATEAISYKRADHVNPNSVFCLLLRGLDALLIVVAALW